jgi:hypothetical protein
MKKLLILVIAFAGLTAMSETSSAFSTSPCKSCHAIDHDGVGPAWARVAKEYGNAEELAKVFKSGFKMEDRKIASTETKFKNKSSTMTLMYRTYIKGHEDEAAKAIFDAVKSDKM